MKKKKKNTDALITANSNLSHRLTIAATQLESARNEANKWRGLYEQAISSPEIKADTEASFKRGTEHARRSLTAYLIDELGKVKIEE